MDQAFAHHPSKKKPAIHWWKIRRLFGQLVLVGYVSDRPVCQPLLWCSHGNFGCGLYNDQVQFRMGTPAHNCWGLE